MHFLYPMCCFNSLLNLTCQNQNNYIQDHLKSALFDAFCLTADVFNRPLCSLISLFFHFFSSFQMQFMLLFSRQGKLRLQKWYVPLSDKEKKKITRELVQTVLARKPKMCSFLEWRDLKIVYKRYASLYFCCAIEDQDNELITLEIIHRYVELLDKYFGSVCELDIIFNFEKAYFILDEFLLGGEAQETSKKNVLKAIEQADLLQENIDFQMRLFAAPS
uniref:AP-1 complex subunit sigma-2 n=1 Tax=Acanthochromis polyacanthus TaxID=80966 RepID=A0A3Q1FSJ0_9TELE